MLEYLGPNNKIMGLQMALPSYLTVSILFTTVYRPREQVGCTPSRVEKTASRTHLL